ncbi:MAG: AgmX/PglI C-terminal domain-containing protein [Myxococcota bacterium]
MRWNLLFGLLLATQTSVVHGAPPSRPSKAQAPRASTFAERLASLEKTVPRIEVRMTPDENPDAVPLKPTTEGPILISGQRLGIYTPPVLSPEDVQLVIHQNMADIRRCYKRQLKQDPEWADRLILDLAIKRNGRISEVGVAPRRVRRAEIGRCLMRTVPRWRFPKFTGETTDGITQEVMTASLPFAFGR